MDDPKDETDAEAMRDASEPHADRMGDASDNAREIPRVVGPKPVATMPGKNGGRLNVGPTERSMMRPAGGRPANILRERLRAGFEERIPVLEAIADGEPVRRTMVKLSSVWRFVKCPNCDHTVRPDDVDADEILIEATVSATPRERIAALQLMAEMGLGRLKALSREEVSGRLLETIRVIKATLPEDQASDLLARIAPLWR